MTDYAATVGFRLEVEKYKNDTPSYIKRVGAVRGRRRIATWLPFSSLKTLQKILWHARMVEQNSSLSSIYMRVLSRWLLLNT